MATLLDVSAGRIRIKDTDGTTVFDTEERLFCATNSVSGSISVSARTASNTNSVNTLVNFETDHVLASVNTAADTVRGALYVTTTSGSGLITDRGWFNASGTYVHQFSATAPILASGSNSQVSVFALYTFFASGGTLYMKERVAMRSATSLSPSITLSVTIPASTFQYNLLCGTFV